MIQLTVRRHFVIEKLAGSNMFGLPSFRELWSAQQVVTVNFHQFMSGLRVYNEPIGKNTALWASSPIPLEPLVGVYLEAQTKRNWTSFATRHVCQDCGRNTQSYQGKSLGRRFSLYGVGVSYEKVVERHSILIVEHAAMVILHHTLAIREMDNHLVCVNVMTRKLVNTFVQVA